MRLKPGINAGLMGHLARVCRHEDEPITVGWGEVVLNEELMKGILDHIKNIFYQEKILPYEE